MTNFLKWEFKQSTKSFLPIIILMTLATGAFWAFLGIQILPSFLGQEGQVHMINGRIDGSLVLGLTVLGTFGLTVAAYIGFFVNILRSFINDLYTKEGNLKATLPITKKSYLAVKYMIPILWMIILTSLFILENIVFSKLIAGVLFDTFKSFFSILNSWKIFLATGINTLLALLFFIAIMYFFITLTKVVLPNKNSGIIGVIIGFVFLIIYTRIEAQLPSIVGTFQLDLVTNQFQYITEAESHFVNLGPQNIIFDNIILELTLIVISFLGTVQLLKKKVDL